MGKLCRRPEEGGGGGGAQPGTWPRPQRHVFKTKEVTPRILPEEAGAPRHEQTGVLGAVSASQSGGTGGEARACPCEVTPHPVGCLFAWLLVPCRAEAFWSAVARPVCVWFCYLCFRGHVPRIPGFVLLRNPGGGRGPPLLVTRRPVPRGLPCVPDATGSAGPSWRTGGCPWLVLLFLARRGRAAAVRGWRRFSSHRPGYHAPLLCCPTPQVGASRRKSP